MKLLPQKLSYRHAISISAAVLVAGLINAHYSVSFTGWMVMVAFLVSQTTRGTPFSQSIYFSLIILAAIATACLLKMIVPIYFIPEILAIILFIISGWVAYINSPIQNTTFYFTVLFSLVFLLTVCLQITTIDFLQHLLFDAAIGALIGIVCGQIILPLRIDKEFINGLLPFLSELKAYSHAMSGYFKYVDSDSNEIQEIKNKITAIFQNQRNLYPEWVYELGFNPGLRSGFRYFLIHLERIMELMLSTNYLLDVEIKNYLPADVWLLVADVFETNTELINVLILRLENQPVIKTNTDFTSDVDNLEKEIKRIIPGGLDLIGFSLEYTQIAMLLRNLRDQRNLLLQLIMALPATI